MSDPSNGSADVIASLPARATLVPGPGGGYSHAVIPYEDYIQIIAADMARRGEAVLDDPNTEWIDFEDVITEFAAPNLAKHRKARGLTQKQLADKMGIPQSQVARMEKNPKSVTYKTLDRIAKALGCDVSKLVA